MFLKKYFITVIFISLLLCLPMQKVNALYSPTISQNVAIIKEHILSSQAKNGTADVLEAIEDIKAYNKLRREGGYESGLSGEARLAMQMIEESSYLQARQHLFDSLAMVFNLNLYNREFISNCLRNEIWGLESLRDLVGQEMIKSYLKYDPVHGNLLKNDYLYLMSEIDRLKKYGSDPNAWILGQDASGKYQILTSNEYYFNSSESGSGAVNMFTRRYFNSDATGCPEGEFERAFENVNSSWQTLKVLGSGQGPWSADNASWGNIWEMARVNAKQKAKQWIIANQISLTLGKEEGASVNSLVKGGGWDRFVGKAKTELQIVDSMVGVVNPLFEAENWAGSGDKKCAYYLQEQNKYTGCTDAQKEQFKLCKSDPAAAKNQGINCDRFKDLTTPKTLGQISDEQLRLIKNNQKDKEAARTAFTYSINLDSIAEQSILTFDEDLSIMNGFIQQGYEKYGIDGGGSIPRLTYELSHVTRNMCMNKQ